MKLLSRLGWGIVIYAIMYLSWNGLAIYGLSQGITSRIIELVVLVIITTIAGRALRFNSWKDILPYSIGWAVIVIGLDAVFTLPFSGSVMYTNWNVWIGYALVMFLPLAAPQTRVFRDDLTHIS